jgi:hypothetical protein
MSSRTRMMGAGNATSTSYNSNVNLNTGGGNKKQGITSRVGLDNWANLAVQTYSNGYGRNKLFVMNQLGGVGAGRSMFNGRFTQVGGVHAGPSIRQQLILLRNLIQFYTAYNPYVLSMVGDKETFKQDMIDAGYPNLAEEAHGRIIHFDDAFVFPYDLPNRDEIISIVSFLNGLARSQIPSVTNGIDFGNHTVALIPSDTANLLLGAGYGSTLWYGLRVFNSAGSDYTFSPNQDGTVTIDKYNGPSTIIEIPGTTPEGQTVSALGIYAFSYSSVTNVTIPNSVTSIGNDAFFNCTNLRSVTIPNSVTTIGSGAFISTSLETLIIPNSVTTIGNLAFYQCFNLSSVTMSTSVTSIGSSAFGMCNVASYDLTASNPTFYANTFESSITVTVFVNSTTITPTDSSNVIYTIVP